MLRRCHEEPRLRAPPQDVFGGARPFMLYEIAHLALPQPGAVVLTQVAIADHGIGVGAVPPKNGAQRRFRDAAVAREEGVARLLPGGAAKIAPGERPRMRPRCSCS